MKRKWKIILSILVVPLIVFAYFSYNVYHTITRSEKIEGKHENIPSKNTEVNEITVGYSDWPNWRGPNLDGKSSLTGINKDWADGLEKLWEVNYLCQGQATASWSAPVIVGNRLVIPGRDEKNDLVFCINTDNGELIWQKSYEAEAGKTHGPGSRATPYIDSNYVYTFGRSGDLVCWQLVDGKQIWKKNVKKFGGIEPNHGHASSPLVYEDKVIVQGGGNALVIAFDKINGDIIWKSMIGDAGYASITLIQFDDETKLLIYHGKALSCIDPKGGNELWSIPWETPHGVNATTPAVENNLIFHTSGYEMGGQGIEASLNNYKVLWKNDAIAAHHSDPIIIDGYIYGYSGQSGRNNGEFKCVELKTGKEMWSTKQIGWGTTTYADGHLICMDIKGNIFLIKPNPEAFHKIAEIKNALGKVRNAAWTVPVVANGRLYLRYLQTLVCYDLM